MEYNSIVLFHSHNKKNHIRFKYAWIAIDESNESYALHVFKVNSSKNATVS